METDIFTWKGIDQLDTREFNFYDVTLVVDVGPYKVGARFPIASLDYGTGKFELYLTMGDEVPVIGGRLQASIVEVETSPPASAVRERGGV